jgi:tetratricopeptide (TPR) repeat protein
MAAGNGKAAGPAMDSRVLTRYGGWLLVLVLFVLLQPVSSSVTRDRLVQGLERPMPATRLVEKDFYVVPGVIAAAILGGFREIAAAALWMKADELWNSGHGTEMKTISMMRTSTLLDPHWVEPWRITGWHLCYNMFVETKDPALRAKYLQMGTDCLKEGIAWNPDRHELYLELGWTYFDKVRDYDEAARWLGRCLTMEHPEYVERLIAHAYERQPQMEKALDWYDYCIKRNPADTTASGATLTIRERYLRGWRLAQEGKYDEALTEIGYYLAVKPEDPLPNHMKAYILEKAGRLKEAHDVWTLVASEQQLNSYARANAARLARKLGLPEEEEPTDILRRQSGGAMAVPEHKD